MSILRMPAKYAGLTRAGHAFEQRTPRGSEILSAGCAAQINGQCGRLAVVIGVEGEAPPEATPTWAMHGLCASCAEALGLVVKATGAA